MIVPKEQIMSDKKFLVELECTSYSSHPVVYDGIEDFRDRGWDFDYSNDPDDEFEQTLGEWLELAEVGEKFHSDEERYQITRIS